MKQTLTNIRNSALVPYHWTKGFLAANHFDYPASSMTVIGVTGTNGKTSTCYMIYNTLLKAGYRVGMTTTISNAINDQIEEKQNHMTTADPRKLNRQIAQMRDAGIHYLVLEVSSHALAQGRVFGIPIDIAVMTNVTPEHLDYHRTFERYLKAKTRLFKMAAMAAKHGGRGVGIANADDPSTKYFTREVPKAVTYGINSGDWRATRIKLTTKGSEYYTRIDKQSYHIKVNIPGEFYVYNSLAAVAACQAVGLTKQQIEIGISDLSGVSGRMEHVANKLGFDVIVDFAHTPDAYEKLLPGIHQATKGKVIIVCGAAGKRDRSKFPLMGKLAAKSADMIILTEEDPRGPVRPLSELLAKGVRAGGKVEGQNLLFIDDRKTAIETALKMARRDDTVLLLGIGHQKTIERAHGADQWDEPKIAGDILAKLAKSTGKNTSATKKTK